MGRRRIPPPGLMPRREAVRVVGRGPGVLLRRDPGRGKGEGGGAARACADLAPAAPRPQRPSAGARARGREEGRAGPSASHVTPVEKIGAAAAEGSRQVKRSALTAGARAPPPPESLNCTVCSARLVIAVAASLPSRRREQEKRQLGRRR